MSKRSTFMAGGILVALAAVGVVANQVLAQDDDRGGAGVSASFSNRSIKGAWGFSGGLAYGVPPGFPQPLPLVAVGRLTFDGVSKCSVENVVNVNGQASRFKSRTCHYSVTPDGMGTAEADFPDAPVPGSVPVAFVITDNGKEIRLINTNFLVASLTARRQ
jgi:hypothetical protein